MLLSLFIGILSGYLFIRIHIDLIYLIATVPAVAVILILCCYYSKFKLLIYFLFCVLFLIAGIFGSYFKIKNFTQKELVGGDTYTVSATVGEKAKTEQGREYLVVENIKANGQAVKGKMQVYLSSSYGDFCDVGYKVDFTAKISVNDTFPYGKLSYNAEKNVKYSCFVQNGLTAKYHFSLFGSINSALRETLYNNLDDDTASVVYAMLTGNSNAIEDETLSAFRYGGIAHIFAISGLHIGIIYGLLQLLSKKLHLNKYITLLFCILPIFFYAGICGFTVSSVRALIMCGVALLSKTFFVKYDALNSLSLSAIIILLINPLTLFNVGFQLTLSAVGAIILLSKNITRPFKKIPAKIKDTVGVSLSAQAGTMPVMLARFGYLSGAGIILNIILVPLLSLFFSIIFVGSFISLIFPFLAAYILPYAAMPLEATVSFFVNAGFEKALISGFGAGAFLPIYYLGLFALSDKFNLKLLHRLTAVGFSVIFLCVYVPIKNFTPFSGHKIIISAYYNSGVVLIKSDEGNILILTETADPAHTFSFLNEYYSHNVDAVILLGGENCVSTLNKFETDSCVYVYGKYLHIQPYNKEILFEESFEIGSVNFEFADGYSLKISCDGINVAVCVGDYVTVENYDLLVCDCSDQSKDENAVSFNNRSYENCVYNDGNFEFLLKNGKITK